MDIEPETPEQRKARLEMEGTCAGIGNAVGHALPPGVGFCLVIFDFGGKGNMAYVGNGDREDVIRMLGELRDKIRRQ